MARPESFTDLPADSRRVKLIDIHFARLGSRPGLSTDVTKFMQSLVNVHLVELVEEYSGIGIYAPATDAELKRDLEGAQSTWDYNRKQYDAYVAGESPSSEYALKSLVRWAAENDLAAPADARAKREAVEVELLRAELAGAVDAVEAEAAEVDEHYESAARVIRDEPQA